MTRAFAGPVALAVLLACSPRATAFQASADEGQHADPDAQSWRLESDLGVVWVWQPAEYRADTAGIVIYVHGYGAPVDEVWTEHDLAGQFAASGRNALFIVPEAPQSHDEPVFFDSVDAVFSAVHEAGIIVPAGPLTVVGHSGAYRTILNWLPDRRLRNLILLDGLYGKDTPFRAWIKPAKGRPARQLVLVGADTARKADRFVRRYGSAVRRNGIPDDVSAFTRREISAPVLYLRSQYDHIQMVQSGRVLPVLLRLTDLKTASLSPRSLDARSREAKHPAARRRRRR